MAHHRVPVASGRPQHTRGREGPCTCARQRVRPTAWPPDDLTPVDGEISPQPSEWVIEFDRPTRKSEDGAKSDALDAVRAAREMLGRKRLSIPRAHDGAREAIRVHAVTRAAAVRARTAAINELKAIIVTADESLRAQVRGLRTAGQVDACAKFRDRPCSAVAERATRSSMRSLARRVQLLDTEIDEHDQALKQLLDQAAPQLVVERGIGYVTAAQLYIAWSHPGRCHSEAAFARLGGTSPVPATSGQNQTRHRHNAVATASSTARSTSSPSRSGDAIQRPRPTSPAACGDSSSTRRSALDRHRSTVAGRADAASSAGTAGARRHISSFRRAYFRTALARPTGLTARAFAVDSRSTLRDVTRP